MRKRWTRACVPVALALVGLGLSACGSAGRASSTTSAADVVGLVAGGVAASAQESEVGAAQYVLTADCMKRKGFTLPPLGPPAPNAENETPRLFYDGGDLATVPPEAASLKIAGEIGYGIAAGRSRLSRQPVSGGSYLASRTGARLRDESSPREEASSLALGGPDQATKTFTVAGIAQHTYPTVGCVAASYAALYGSPLLAVEAGYLPEDLGLAVRHDVLADPRFLAAARSWSGCFAAATSRRVSSPYSVTTSLLEGERLGRGPVDPQTREYEIQLAVADARCEYSTHFIQTTVALRLQYAGSLSAPYEGLLLDILEARARAIRNARNILSAAGR